MLNKKHLFYIVAVALIVLTLPVEALQMPNYANGGGNLTSDLQSKGKAVTDIISLIVAMLGIIGILVGAGYFTAGKRENGMQWVVGGIVGLIIAGSVYGIAGLVT
jgi:hypothetical protein